MMNRRTQAILAAAVRGRSTTPSLDKKLVPYPSPGSTYPQPIKADEFRMGIPDKPEEGFQRGPLTIWTGTPIAKKLTTPKLDGANIDQVFTKLQDEAEKSTLDLDSKTKDQLLEYANLIGDGTIRKSWTKAKILEALKAMLDVPAKS